MCGCDFSEILSLSKKIGGIDRPSLPILNFRMALFNCNLVYLGCKGPMITWINKIGKGNYIQERLDRFVCEKKWQEMFPQALVEHLDLSKSNHRPILL